MLTVTLNPAVDISMRVPVIEPDRKIHCSAVNFEAGGGGVNVARVAHTLGAAVRAILMVGGGSGDRLVALLAAEGVATDHIVITGTTRECFTVLESATGRQYRFVLPGPAVDRSDLRSVTDLISSSVVSGSLVVVSGSLPEAVTAGDFASLLQWLRRAGARLIVDTDGPALAAAAAVGTTFLKPSRRELAQVTGSDLDDDAEIERAARRLLDQGPNSNVLVSLGAAGALLVCADGPAVRIHAPSVHAVSTVGAGDSLVAATAVALERDGDVTGAARWGVAAGTAATLTPGTGLCRRADVERLLDAVTITDVRRSGGAPS